MRLKLILNHKPGQTLPINYAYFISAWIYKTIAEANKEYAEQLHSHGYEFNGKKFKLFTYGKLAPQWFNIDKKRQLFILKTPPTSLSISFYVNDALTHLITSIFKNQSFSLGNEHHRAELKVETIEVEALPQFKNKMRFKSISPIFMSSGSEDEKYAHYMSPEEDGYGEMLIRNLVQKKAAFEQKEENIILPDFEFKLLSEAKPRLQNIKGIKIKAYEYDFEIGTPRDLLELGYLAGFGGKNSALGMGMVEILG